jgi:hypothetical protein
VPAGIVGWYLGVMLALGIVYLTQNIRAFMHTGSSLAAAAGSPTIENLAIIVGALCCGALAVALPAWVAPAHRDRIALLAYAIGLACSTYWLFNLIWQPVACAALSGAVACWWLQGFRFARQSLRPRA